MKRGLFGFLIVASLCAGNARGDVRMPALFGDHMVLQQNMTLSVWGMADPGEQISVTVGSSKGKITADAAGKWMAKLPPLPVSATPVEMQVEGKNKLVIKDVLVGDVWLCSGQSNMEFGIGNAPNAKEAIPKMNYPSIRMFLLPHVIAYDLETDVPREKSLGQWVVCTPQSVTNIGGWWGFSSAGLFFARDIYEQRKEPLGLIGAYCGGSPIQAWMSLEALRSNPGLAKAAAQFETTKADLPALKQKYETEVLAKWQQEHDAWQAQVGQPLPEGTQRPKEPARPAASYARGNVPSTLYNGMINPLIPYGIKGAIWYQGESNAGREEGRAYASYFATMITDWRQRWGQGDFPFIYAQLSGWKGAICCTYVRDSQLKTLALPHTGMAVTMDIGDLNDIHPKDKLNVGRRLALAARHVAYGENLVYSGPIVQSVKEEGNKMRVAFQHVGGGLVIGSAPAAKADDAPAPKADQLNGFEIAGADKKFVPAQARIDGAGVVAWSDAVPQPKEVSYCWSPFPVPPANLYNKEGLPASPFNSVEGLPSLSH
ncbi:MAG: sialate O-acetylesterase [Chthoniobacteraceae bacterium]|nr:sialate O-acetylesterase [Chthoniobacteraceae bacterium]